ncbi:MAG: hypothetical protein HOJ34_07785 [Kordiimonadaceae bacterium]|jgi:hypothetical protein|nr:hypothetical protein [Kordiimonadaceae bacterium]MBT6036276.1 hypothetical protein [Kordiimonadaceae bacterium]MBT6329666.1 hypothetical protein [Kordiimonadaceae bacterium]MBT7581928.1 hypothetical protein [Kordiimonadaceae bacterium]
MNIKIYFLLILTGLVLNVSAFGQARDNTYLRMTNTSAKIVKGKITHREAIEYDYDGERLVCGYVLDISVVQSWKGGTEDFKVFSSNSDIIMDGEVDYFLFARRNNNFGNNTKVEFINCDGGKSTRMDISGFEYLATRLRQQIFPIISYDNGDSVIDTDTNVMKRGDWMMIVNRISNSALPYTIARRRLNNGNENVIEEMSLSDFISEFITD